MGIKAPYPPKGPYEATQTSTTPSSTSPTLQPGLQQGFESFPPTVKPGKLEHGFSMTSAGIPSTLP